MAEENNATARIRKRMVVNAGDQNVMPKDGAIQKRRGEKREAATVEQSCNVESIIKK